MLPRRLTAVAVWAARGASAANQCAFPLPVVAVSMNSSGAHANRWRDAAAARGIASLHMWRGVDGGDDKVMAKFLPDEALRYIQRLSPRTRHVVRKKISNWAVTRSFCASVARGAFGRVAHSSGAVLKLEDDAQLASDFCEASSRVLDALPARGDWDMLYLGHCAEATHRVRSCRGVRGPSGQTVFVSKGKKPMCTHAYAVTPRGAARVYKFLEDWPAAYLGRIANATEPSEASAGASRAFWEVDRGHDFDLAHSIKRSEIDAFLAWPPTATQSWQVSPVLESLRPAPSTLPRACRHEPGSETKPGS